MEILEMVNRVRFLLNKINSDIFDDLQDEEIVSELNTNMFLYIKHHYSPLSNSRKEGFEMTAKRKSDLRKCIVPFYTNTLYQNTYGEDKTLQFTLPYNFEFLISNKTNVYYNKCDAITYSLTSPTQDIFVIPFSELSDTITDFSEFDITMDGISIFGSTDEFAKYLYPDDTDDFGAYITEYLNDNTIPFTVYWETYRDKKYPQSLILEVSDDYSTPIEYKFSGEEYTTANLVEYSYSYYSSFTNGKLENFSNTELTWDEVNTQDSNPFIKPIYYEPTITLGDDYIFWYYSGNNFIANQMTIAYIRKPKRMSLLRNQDCELAEHTHDEIIKMTISSLKAAFLSESYQIALNEENKSE